MIRKVQTGRSVVGRESHKEKKEMMSSLGKYVRNKSWK
jgi:hypothetical protein